MLYSNESEESNKNIANNKKYTEYIEFVFERKGIEAQTFIISNGKI